MFVDTTKVKFKLIRGVKINWSKLQNTSRTSQNQQIPEKFVIHPLHYLYTPFFKNTLLIYVSLIQLSLNLFKNSNFNSLQIDIKFIFCINVIMLFLLKLTFQHITSLYIINGLNMFFGPSSFS